MVSSSLPAFLSHRTQNSCRWVDHSAAQVLGLTGKARGPRWIVEREGLHDSQNEMYTTRHTTNLEPGGDGDPQQPEVELGQFLRCLDLGLEDMFVSPMRMARMGCPPPKKTTA